MYKNVPKNIRRNPIFFVVPAGFEPTYSESKSDVLPLDEGTMSVVGLQLPEAPTLSRSSLYSGKDLHLHVIADSFP